MSLPAQMLYSSSAATLIDTNMASSELSPASCTHNLLPGKASMAELDSMHAPESKQPLHLLDLPIDILKEIIDHLPHANDLTSLALCHSVLHSLVIPYIYSRFDIVWPEHGTQSEARGGVDALTYGLATLVKAQEIFGEAAFQSRKQVSSSTLKDPYPIRKRRLGNCYAQYTKKFSLGNGPLDCVQEYLITKEAGKMLGTLIALAVARMPNLETFIWDMPTGVLRDVWLALSSLGSFEEDCKLEKVWVRWHNNYQAETSDPPPPPPPIIPGVSAAPNVTSRSNNRSVSHSYNLNMPFTLEHPSFSVLPPLKSLNVLEIDELVYLDEMSILIARSQHILKELRVGIAQHVKSADWTANWEGDEYRQVDHDTTWTVASNIGHKRLQGVLGILVARVYNLRNNDETAWQAQTIANIKTILDNDESKKSNSSRSSVSSGSQEFVSAVEMPQGEDVFDSLPPYTSELPIRSRHELPKEVDKCGPYLNGILKLETLELEHVDLSMPVLRKAIDWTCLTTLTLLHCVGHERLWRLLRDRYSNPFRSSSSSKAVRSSWNYSLNIRHLQTNRVSSHLLAFIRDSLAPNSLELVFLQDSFAWRSPVKIEAIFKDIVRRHHNSLKKLMIDSNSGRDNWSDLSETDASRWRKWALDRSQVAYITSGRMRNLRELAVSIDYSDWHIFLQRLPRMQHVRSLYIPHIVGHPHGGNLDIQETALHVVDIVSLRPEMELCYMAIGGKCFEILERQGPVPRRQSVHSSSTHRSIRHEVDVDEEDQVDDNDEEPPDEEEGYSESDLSNSSDGERSDWGGERQKSRRLWLQEILFYDKITIFKARHGKL